MFIMKIEMKKNIKEVNEKEKPMLKRRTRKITGRTIMRESQKREDNIEEKEECNTEKVD